MTNKRESKRICVHPKDVAEITGFSEGYCRKLLRKIKAHYQKLEHQLITIMELCEFLGLPEDTVRRGLN